MLTFIFWQFVAYPLPAHLGPVCVMLLTVEDVLIVTISCLRQIWDLPGWQDHHCDAAQGPGTNLDLKWGQEFSELRTFWTTQMNVTLLAPWHQFYCTDIVKNLSA